MHDPCRALAAERTVAMKAEVQKEHQWLHQLVGEWTFEMDCPAAPDQPGVTSSGWERVRLLGGVWVVSEGEITASDGTTGTTLMTLGYDPAPKRYIGTWLGTMMTHLWVYEGELDASGKVLTLNTEGPEMSPDGMATGKLARYRDVIEVRSDEHRILTSHVLTAEGKWHQFMTSHYHRRK
jgi:hypothetical protein